MKSFRQRWAVGAAGFALTVIAATQMVSSEARSDPEPPAPLRRGDAGAPATLAQCGDCHMIFPARMLPSRSWTAILSRMDDHFGENAAIPEKDLQEIWRFPDFERRGFSKCFAPGPTLHERDIAGRHALEDYAHPLVEPDACGFRLRRSKAQLGQIGRQLPRLPQRK